MHDNIPFAVAVIRQMQAVSWLLHRYDIPVVDVYISAVLRLGELFHNIIAIFYHICVISASLN